MRSKKVTPRNLKKVLDSIAAMETFEKADFCVKFNEFLDELLSDDFFGTEGQNDPRGDRRSE